MESACETPEARRYRPWILGWSIVTAIALLLSSSVLSGTEYGPAARLVIAMAPIVMLVGMIALMARQVRHLDEMQRRIHLEALAIAFPAAAIIALAVEYLQKAGFAEGWTIGDVWPWMLLVYVPAYFLARRRYR